MLTCRRSAKIQLTAKRIAAPSSGPSSSGPRKFAVRNLDKKEKGGDDEMEDKISGRKPMKKEEIV